MMQGLQRGFAALALAVVPVGYGPAADTDGMVPDLEIAVVGIKDPAKPREVTVRVTNVGPAWADHTRATVWAEPESAGEKLEDEDVLDLSPIGQEKEQDTPSHYEFVYTLAAPCGGQKVTLHASLTAGEDWEGDPEPKERMVNNVIPRPGQDGVVCQAQAQPQSNVVPSQTDSGVVKPAGSAASREAALGGALEDLARPSPSRHTDKLAANAAVTVTKKESSCPEHWFSKGLQVGWLQRNRLALDPTPDCWAVAQTAVNFDLNFLEQPPKKTLKTAVLRFEEKPVTWRDGYGNWNNAEGPCVQVLGRATEEWQGRPGYTALFPNEKVQGHTPGVQEWYVTTDIADQWVPPRRYQPLGLVLRGGNESPKGNDDRSCMSEISAITLEVTYEIP